MDYPFRTFSPVLLLAALTFACAANFEVRFPVKMEGQKIMAAYPVCFKLFCICMLIFVVFFAFALAAVHRESIESRIGIFSTLGIPVTILAIEILGKKIEVDGDIVVRSYFGAFVNKRKIAQVVRVEYDKAWLTFKVYFDDRSTLWIPTIMRGTVQLAQKLNPSVP